MRPEILAVYAKLEDQSDGVVADILSEMKPHQLAELADIYAELSDLARQRSRHKPADRA